MQLHRPRLERIERFASAVLASLLLAHDKLMRGEFSLLLVTELGRMDAFRRYCTDYIFRPVALAR